MVWFVAPLQRRRSDGAPSGLWHLVAESDENGGFHPCCSHDHDSAEAASACEAARATAGSITGVPNWGKPMSGDLASCPKCGLEFSSMLHPFCQNQGCPPRDFVPVAERRVSHVEAIRKAALAKLTAEERSVLGV